jgi:hypothetical protein
VWQPSRNKVPMNLFFSMIMLELIPSNEVQDDELPEV